MKVKPRKGGRFRRRAVTIAIYAGAWLALTALMPVWALLGVLIGVVRRRSFILLRLLFFGWFYFGLELLALSLIGIVFVTQRDRAARAETLYRLQAWWASANLTMASALLRLRIVVENASAAVPGPSILFIRHASILDTLLPCAYVQRHYGLRVRYVLKQELLFDPCIDIVGNALPNYFVDRGGNTLRELEGIRALVADLGEDSVLIFPEGTRFSPEKRERALLRLEAEGSPLAEPGRAMTHVLPPKPGGPLALVDALPEVDLVFFAHTGLETFAKIENLLSGEVVGSTVSVKLWRIPWTEVPRNDAERLEWLYAQWCDVDAFIRRARLTE